LTDEDTVWYYTKERLNSGDFRIIGGEPPGGSSPVPRIELREPGNTSKGSGGSRKFDLYILHDGRIILCEAKDSAAKVDDDIVRLDSTVDSEDWTGALWDAMDQRGLIHKWGLPPLGEFIDDRHNILRKALAIPHTPSFDPPGDYLLFETDEEETTIRAGQGFLDDDMLEALEEHLEEYGRMTSFRQL
jgi:hypothetical protein